MTHTKNLFTTKVFLGLMSACVVSVTPDLKQLVIEGTWNRTNTWNVIYAFGSVLGITVLRYVGDDPDHPLLHTPNLFPGRDKKEIILPEKIETLTQGLSEHAEGGIIDKVENNI